MAKRFTKPRINWNQLENKVPPEQKAKFLAFKGKSEMYLRRVLSLPAERPKIDWEEYKKNVPVKGLVDKFKTQYESFYVPYPDDIWSPEVEKQWVEMVPAIEKYCAEMDHHIEVANKEIKRLKDLPSYEETTMEMVYDLFPDYAIDPVKNPTFWPHTADEQLDFEDPTTKVQH